MFLKRFIKKFTIVCILFFIILFSYYGDVDSKELKIQSRWNFAIEAMINNATGNSNYDQYVGKFNAKRKSKENLLDINLGYNNQRTKGRAIVDDTYLDITFEENITKNRFIFGDFSVMRERLKNYKYRGETHYGIGYNNRRRLNNLKVRIGEGTDYRVYENGQKNIFFETSARIDYIRLFRSIRKFKMESYLEYEVRNDNPSKFSIEGEVAFISSITRHLAFKFGTKIVYDNQHSEITEKTDTLSGASLIYRF